MPRCFNPGARYHEKLAAMPPEEAAKVEANRCKKMSAGIKKTLAMGQGDGSKLLKKCPLPE